MRRNAPRDRPLAHHDWLENNLEKVDDMLAGLADLHSDYRSAEEIRGGILAARERLREMWRRVSAAPRPARERVISLPGA